MKDKSILVRLEEAGGPAPRLSLDGDMRAGRTSSDARYDVVDEIADGSVGIVQRGHDNDLGRDVALKVLRAEHLGNEELVRHFVEEAQIGGQLQHPGIVPVYELGLFGDRPYFAMKLLKGETLAERLRRRTEPAEDRRALLAVFRDVCRTMSYAHSRSVVHDDLEPGNVMIGGYGEVQVVDWGRARIVDDAATEARADIASLGAMLGEILTGSRGAGEALAALAACGQDGDLVALCRRCLEPASADGPVGAGMLADAVATWLADSELRAHRAELAEVRASAEAEEQRRSKRQTRLVAGGVVLVVLLVVGLLAYVNIDRAARERERRTSIEAAREDASRLEAAGDWELALAAAQRAVELGADATEVDRIRGAAEAAAAAARRAADDERFLAELERIRGRRSGLAMTDERGLTEVQDDARADAAWAAAFERQGGLDRLTERLGAADDAAAFAANLDFWCWMRKQRLGAAAWQPIDDLARRIDPSNTEVRDALLAETPRALLAIADEHIDELPATLAARVGLAIAAMPGKAERGLGFLRAQLERAPSDFWLHMHIAEVARGLRQWDLAVRHATSAIALRPRDVAAWCDLATALWGKSDPAGAVAALRHVAATAPDSALAHARLGAVLGATGDHEGAIAELRRAIDLDAGDATTRMNLGVVLASSGALAEAVASHRRAIALAPSSAAAHRHLATALDASGEPAGAMPLRQRAAELDRERAFAHARRAGELERTGDAWGAIAELRHAVALAPDEMTPNLNLGASLSNADDATGAIPFLRRAVELGTDDALTFTNLGSALSNSGSLDEATSMFRRALELDPQSVLAHKNLGITLLDRRDVSGAIVEFRRAIELAPDDPSLHTRLANALEHARDPAAAMATYRRAIELDPDDASLHGTLGEALARWRDRDGAIAAYRRAVDLAPEEVALRIALADLLVDRGDEATAIAEYRNAVASDPRSAWAWTSLGGALSNAGELEEATQALRRAVELDRGFVRAHRFLGITLDKSGDRAGAIDCFRRVLQLDRRYESSVAERLSLLERQLRLEPRFAQVLAGAAVELRPDECVVLADMLYEQKHFARSAEMYARAFATDAWLAVSTDPLHRYNAACSAALAGGAWRAQALGWLCADLELRRVQLETNAPWVEYRLRHWQQDADLASIRDAGDLEPDFAQLWRDVEQVRQTAAERLRR